MTEDSHVTVGLRPVCCTLSIEPCPTGVHTSPHRGAHVTAALVVRRKGLAVFFCTARVAPLGCVKEGCELQ